VGSFISGKFYFARARANSSARAKRFFRRSQLVEDMLERLLASLFHKLGDGAVRDNRSFVNNHDPFADSARRHRGCASSKRSFCLRGPETVIKVFRLSAALGVQTIQWFIKKYYLRVV